MEKQEMTLCHTYTPLPVKTATTGHFVDNYQERGRAFPSGQIRPRLFETVSTSVFLQSSTFSPYIQLITGREMGAFKFQCFRVKYTL